MKFVAITRQSLHDITFFESPRMRLAVDEVIPYWQEAFAGLGEIRTFSGRKLLPVHVRDADALIVRSVTRVDASVLEGSSVQFVGSATIGLDHLDTAYLKARGIHFTNAAGSNANSVAEYVTAALLLVAGRKGWDLQRKSVAIVGNGHVGTAVEKKVRALGMPVLLCDPPLREVTGDLRYQDLDDVLDADILTLHTPLTRQGRYPTWHMIGGDVLGRLSPHQFLINSCRGSVVQGPALKQALLGRKIAGAVLDVWEEEPGIDYELLDLVDLGSAHIAGFSLDGKVRGTEMILESLCGHFGLPVLWDSRRLYPPPTKIKADRGGQDAVASIVLQAYDIEQDDHNLRALRGLRPEEAEARFDRLRNEYALRPEFRHFSVELTEESSELGAVLGELGFRISVPVTAPSNYKGC